MRRLFSLFRLNDAVIFASILILSITAGRLPEIFDPSYPYPTTLYSIFGTIAQSLAPLLAAAFFFLLYAKRKEEQAFLPDLLKGVLLLGCVTLLALALLPFSELIYGVRGVRQGIVVGITLLALWSLGQTVFPIARGLMGGGDERRET